MEIKAIYFSPTRTTEKITMTIAKTVSVKLNGSLNEINIRKNNEREKIPEFSKEDILILGLPVYAGRIPEIVEDYVYNLKGDGTKAIILSVYGNRDYDDALIEMRNILNQNGFSIIAAGAFIGEHSFTNKVGTGRPDEEDLEIAKAFGDSIYVKIKEIGNNATESIEVKGNYPYKERGALPPVAPSTNENCSECMDCVVSCPTDAINSQNPRKTDIDKCILCCECVKICPESAKINDSEAILGLIAMLENKFTERKEPELFI